MFILTQVCVSSLKLEGKHCADVASKMQRLQNHEVKGVYKYVEGLTKLLDNFFCLRSLLYAVNDMLCYLKLQHGQWWHGTVAHSKVHSAKEGALLER